MGYDNFATISLMNIGESGLTCYEIEKTCSIVASEIEHDWLAFGKLFRGTDMTAAYEYFDFVVAKLLVHHPTGRFVVYSVQFDGETLMRKEYGIDDNFKQVKFNVNGEFDMWLTLDTFYPKHNITALLNEDYA